DVDAFVDFIPGWLGLFRLVAPLGCEHVALVALCGQKLSQIGQVLGGGGVVRPVILVDEQDSLTAVVAFCRDAGEMGRGTRLVGGVKRELTALRAGRGGLAPGGLFERNPLAEPATLDHHFASAWALLARYQAMVLASPLASEVGGDQPSRTLFIRVTSSTLSRAPSGLSAFHSIFPR